MCENPVFSRRTKHIDTKFHFIRERVEDGSVKIFYVPTDEMAADLLTKPLAWVKVVKHRENLLGADSVVNPRVLSGGVRVFALPAPSTNRLNHIGQDMDSYVNYLWAQY